jgi:hypothetical protein
MSTHSTTHDASDRAVRLGGFTNATISSWPVRFRNRANRPASARADAGISVRVSSTGEHPLRLPWGRRVH